MKKSVLFLGAICSLLSINAQTLTLVTGKRLYEHHSSTVTGQPFGNGNVNTQSGYDFVSHAYVAAGTASLASSRDMVEHNGYFGWNGPSVGPGYHFGFTSGTSNIAGYMGNNSTMFHLVTAVNFNTITTVQDLVSLYTASAATQADTAVDVNDVYIVKVRNSDTYLALRITGVKNVTPSEAQAIENGPVNVDVYFDFEYKYGTLCVAPTLTVSSSSGTICPGKTVTLTANGADTYSWSTGGSSSLIAVTPTVTTAYSVTGYANGCSSERTFTVNVSNCTGIGNPDHSPLTVICNPFSSELKVKFHTPVRSLAIADLCGHAVYRSTDIAPGDIRINTDTLPDGIFILTCITDSGDLITRKLIKKSN